MDAEEAYRKSISLDPSNATTWGNLGCVLQHTFGDIHGAENAFRRALSAAPASPRAHYNHGWLLQNAMGDTLGAARAYSRAVKVDAEFVDAWMALGHLLQTIGKDVVAMAADAFASAQAHDAAGDAPWFDFACHVQSTEGAYMGAQLAYKYALGAAPNSLTAWYNLGCVHRDNGDVTAAAKAYRHVLAISPVCEQAEWIKQWLNTEHRPAAETHGDPMIECVTDTL